MTFVDLTSGFNWAEEFGYLSIGQLFEMVDQVFRQ